MQIVDLNIKLSCWLCRSDLNLRFAFLGEQVLDCWDSVKRCCGENGIGGYSVAQSAVSTKCGTVPCLRNKTDLNLDNIVALAFRMRDFVSLFCSKKMTNEVFKLLFTGKSSRTTK